MANFGEEYISTFHLRINIIAACDTDRRRKLFLAMEGFEIPKKFT
jgi:hypothetical protein